MSRWNWLVVLIGATEVHAGQDSGNVYAAGWHAFGEPIAGEWDDDAPDDEWRVHLGNANLNKRKTISAQDIADLIAAAHPSKTPAHFDSVAGAIATWYAGLSAVLKSRCRWAWANRP